MGELVVVKASDQMREPQENTRKHLRRLDSVFPDVPIFFLTTCTRARRPILAMDPVHDVFVEEWESALERHGWQVGAYVVMPDHVHFFARSSDDDSAKSLSNFIGAWKEWTSKRLNREVFRRRDQGSLWQPEFFDHLLRSSESYSEKWDYVRDNPVRAGLIDKIEDWPYAGTISDLLW